MSDSAIRPLPPPTYAELIPERRGLVTSLERGWHNMHVFRYDVAAQLEPVVNPIIEAHILALTHSKGNLSYNFGGKSIRSASILGTMSLIPHDVPVTSSWTTPLQASHVMLSAALVKATAADLSTKRPESVELVVKTFFFDPFVFHLYRTLEQELLTSGLYGDLYADTLAQALTLHLLRNYSTLSVPQSLPDHGLSPKERGLVLDYMRDHLERNLSLKELAALVNLSPAYFSQQFKKAVGVPPHQYLIQERVRRAKELLYRGHISVGQVAQAVGFFDQSHLDRHFKRLEGASPSALLHHRKNVQKKP